MTETSHFEEIKEYVEQLIYTTDEVEVKATVTEPAPGLVRIAVRFPNGEDDEPLVWEHIAEKLWRRFGPETKAYEHVSRVKADNGYRVTYIVR